MPPRRLPSEFGRLTFELSRTRRNDARARQKENVPTLLAGPGGMPLGLGFNEGLGVLVNVGTKG